MQWIKRREELSRATYLLEIEYPRLAKAARPGQFVIVMLHEHGERIPLTIADFDAVGGTITLVVQAVGKTTREMQDRCVAGTGLHAIVGPMGAPTRIEPRRAVICAGGGLGVAPVFPILRAHREAGARVTAVLGFRSAELVFWEDQFRGHCDDLIVCTDDGSAGLRGTVADGVAAALARQPATEEVVAIGPPRMMQACAEVTRAPGIPTVVSLNPIMVDGTGMCGGCRVRVGGQTKFACIDGPDFDGHAVDFDDLISRLGRHAAEERAALLRWEGECRLRRSARTLAAGAG